jgi:hypothetical protein
VEGSVIGERTSFPQVDVEEEIIPRRSADCDLERVGGIFVQALELLPEESIIAATEAKTFSESTIEIPKGVVGMSKRRDFIKTTGAALGGMAIAGISSIQTEAQVKPGLTPARSKAGSIAIRCAPNVKIESIHEAVKQALGRVGCPGCGLLGVDIHIGGGDPEPFGIDAPGIKGGSFTPMG